MYPRADWEHESSLLVKLYRPAVNLINILRTNFSYERRFGSLLVTRENDVSTKNARV